MDNSITPNTNTPNVNNFLFNTNLTEQQINKLQSYQKNYQTFSNILEAYISLARELCFTQVVFNFLLALLAFAGNRPTFPASHENLYPLIMDCKDPESAKETNLGTIRKSVWRDLTEVNGWMIKSGITLFTRILPKYTPDKKQEATIYNISFLLYTLLEIVQEAHRTKHLHDNNLGLAIQAAAKLKAQELRQAATPQSPTEKPKKLNPKQKTTIQTLGYHILEVEKGLLKLKTELTQLKSLSNNQIANQIEQAFAHLNNLYSNTILHLRGYQAAPEKKPDFCPTSLQHILYRDLDRTDSTAFSQQSEITNEALGSEETFSGAEIETGSSFAETDTHDRTKLECPEDSQESDLLLENTSSQKENPKFTVTLFENHFESTGTEAELTLEEFAECIRMNDPVVITPKSTDKEDVLAAKQTSRGFSPAIFVSEQEGRKDKNVDFITMACFDFDHADFKIDLQAIVELNFCGFLYTSYCHTEKNHRFRLGFLLRKPIPSQYYHLLWEKLFKILKREVAKEGTDIILNIDQACFNTSRLWYLPAKQRSNSPYYSELFTIKDGFELLDWEKFIVDEKRNFDLGLGIDEIFDVQPDNQQISSEKSQTLEGKSIKNVTQSYFVIDQGSCLDKPSITGYHWPSMFKALADKNGDRSKADSSWCYWCAVFGIPIEMCIAGLLQVSSKAKERFGKVYGSGDQYHTKTAEEAYDFYNRKIKKSVSL